MPTEGPGLSLTEWVVLALLSEAPSHGFAVARTLSRTTPLGEAWTVPRPLVYRALGRLEEQGLIVEAGEEPGDPGPRRMVYEATG
ncbi:MAG TPA: PadR family transcriptional regulator, partial [Acidimicrobiia bacterium]|nr:PadR family transcriptional regulator [Acidimicrobiia bacterium]